MPCKVEIRNSLTNQIESETESGYNLSLEGAQALAKEINSAYKASVVSFYQESSDFIERNISIPDSLVDEYYNNELNIEAREVQIEDAERAGEEYTDDYLFFQTDEQVKYTLKSVKILESDKAKQVFDKGNKNNWGLDKILTELQIPKEQKQLIINSGLTNREEIIVDLATNYSYSVEVNTAKENIRDQYNRFTPEVKKIENKELADVTGGNIGEYFVEMISTDGDPDIKIFKTKEEAENAVNTGRTERNSAQYSNLTVPGGTNYTENEISTPLITPSIKGHAQFSTDNGIGWFRSDEQGIGGEQYKRSYWDSGKNEEVFIDDFDSTGIQPTKTRRILEVQSDLFQKGRDKKYLINGIPRVETGNLITEEEDIPFGNEPIKEFKDDVTSNKYKSNQFLQLLNKDNNWVTFFIKSIIADSAKKGYEKVLFPTGDTASKIEGHSTLEEYKKEKQDRLNKLQNENFVVVEKEKNNYNSIPFKHSTKEDAEKYRQEEDYRKNWIIVDISDSHKTEITQLKQELERVEREGFGALKPIYNFYENTVTNILKKQGYNTKLITDEYGNSWNEVFIDENVNNILLQKEGNSQTKSSPETLAKIKEVAKKMGVEIQELSEYVKGNPSVPQSGLNGVADLIKGVVAIATGREDQALTEEIVHIATAILEQTNPELITSLISKIDKFKIYKIVFDKYSKLKAYQLSNGKPNIRKIKKEAVDQLLVEVLINQTEDATQFPELLQKEYKSTIEKWWDTIKEYIRSLYGKSDISLFEDVANTILNEDIGDISMLNSQEVYYQVDNPVRDEYYNKIVQEDAKLKLNPSTPTDSRHYTYDGERVAKTVTEKLKDNSPFDKERTPSEKEMDDQKAQFGSWGHEFLENELVTNILDKDGFAKKIFTDIPISSNLDTPIQKALREYIRNLVSSYPEGTRFLVEKKMVNKSVKGMLASTIDFKAIIPVTNSDGTPDIKVDTLDWKFTSINKSITDDLPWYKRKGFTEQMLEYVKMDRDYGLKSSQTRKSRMIPFILNYDYLVPGNRNSGIIPTSIEIGKIDSTKETNLYLLPVPLLTESTGNKEVDSLIEALRQQWEKLYKKKVAFEDQSLKNIQLNEIDKAIRQLHIQLDFEPLYNIGKTFLDNAENLLKEFKSLNLNALSQSELENKLGEILGYQESAIKYIDLDKVFLSHISKEDLSDEEKKTLFRLEKLSRATERMLEEATKAQRDFVIELALKTEYTTSETKNTILNPEVAIDWFSKTFLEASKLPSMIINFAANLWLKSKSLTDLSISNKIDDFEKVLSPAIKEASSKGVKVFNLIGNITNGKPRLIRKIDPEFLKQVALAKKDQNKKFFLSNLDMEDYNKQSKALIEKGEKEINSVTFSSDPEQDDKIKTYKITALKNSLDIKRPSFNGYKDFKFSQLVKKTILIEEHLSEEYKNMSKSPAALALWEFILGLNEEALSLGFISKQGMSFLPLVEATILEKLSQTNNVIGQSKNIIKDLYTLRIDEQQAYSAVDKETGEIRKEIPKFFTKTDKKEDELSKDITKIIPLYIKALQEYKNARNMENTLLTLHKVEQSKGSLKLNSQGEIIFKGDEPDVNPDVNKNADLLQVIIDDSLYNLAEDLGSTGNIALNRVAGKFSKTEEGKQENVVSIKKGIKNADTLTRALAVGLKPLIGLANWTGVQFQAFIGAGNVYKFREFEKNNLMVSSGVGFSTTKKALLDLFIPLNEDVTSEKIRDLSKEQSYLKWISTWTFSDVMMFTNSFPERKLQYANALSFLDNSMVVNGKIVNIRQYLKSQDRKSKYNMSFSERKVLENTFEQRVTDLKSSSSLEKIAKVTDEGISIPGVSDEEIANYRVVIKEYARTLNGQMNIDNKAGYRRDSILSSFMMFKTWIPKLLYSRIGDIKMNKELDEWEYGRARAFFKTWANLGLFNIKGLRDVYLGNEEGLKIMKTLLDAKKEEHYKKTGQILEITEEEFYDLMRTQISNQLKELSLLFSLMALVIAAKAAEPPEDATDLERNRYKFWAKALNKISDEVSFYYNPTSADAITRGSIIPSLGLLVKSEKIIKSLGKEVTGYALDDQEMIDKSYPLKYFLNIIPIGAQFQTEILPIVNPELAKEMGIRVTSESRRQ